MTEPAGLPIVSGRAWPTWVEASVLVDGKSAQGAWVATFSYSNRRATFGTMVFTCFQVVWEGRLPSCGRQLWPQCTCRFQVPGARQSPVKLRVQSRRTPAKEDSIKGGL